jgi:hypothetical protein
MDCPGLYRNCSYFNTTTTTTTTTISTSSTITTTTATTSAATTTTTTTTSTATTNITLNTTTSTATTSTTNITVSTTTAYYYSFSLLYNWVYAVVNYIYDYLVVAVSPLSDISKLKQNLTRLPPPPHRWVKRNEGPLGRVRPAQCSRTLGSSYIPVNTSQTKISEM